MHLTDVKTLSKSDIQAYLNLAEEFLDEHGNLHTPAHYADALRGKHIGLLFFEPSTRTRISFELAVKRLGGTPFIISSTGSSREKGESILDTCANLHAMGVDGFIVRDSERQTPYSLTDRLRIPIINAGNGSGEHPTQALLDAFTLRKHVSKSQDLEGLKVTIVGDIVHSRVARSNVYALSKLGAEVSVAGPSTMLPKQSDQWPAQIVTSRKEALAQADAVMVLRIQRERIHGKVLDVDAYVRHWGIDDAVVEAEMKHDAVILHPGPVMRGMEISDRVADGPRSLILKQVRYGVAVRQAVLLHALAARNK